MKKLEPKKAEGKAIAKPVQDRALPAPRSNERPDPTKRRPGVFSRSVLPLLFAMAFQVSSFKCEATITVTGLVSTVTSAALDTKISFIPTENVLVNASGLNGGPAVTTTSTNGAFSIPLDPDNYLVRLPLIPDRRAFTISVGVGTGSTDITNLISRPWTYEDFAASVSGTNGGANVATAGLATASTNGSTVTVNVPETNVIRVAQQQLASGTNTFSGSATLSSLTAASPLSVDFLGGTLNSGNSTMGASGFATLGGVLNPTGFYGLGIGITNATPALATNNATATDGMVLTKTGDKLKLATASGSGDVTAAGLAAGSFPVAGSAVTGALTNRAARTLESVGPQFMRQYSTPPIGFGSWGVFTTEFGNSSGSGYGTNSQKWLTNIIALVKANPALVSAGMDTLYIDDGWQNDVRTGSGDLTWNTNFFPLGMPALAALAKEAGLKLHLYTSVHTQTCMSMPGSGTNNIYRDVQKMMSWNIAGTMVDQCDSGSSWYDTNLLTEFSYLTASAIRDYQANAFASNQPANPFFVHMTTGNGPGTLPQVITWQGLNFYDGIGVSDGYSDSSLVPAISIAGKNSLKLLASWIKPGHSPMFNWLYSGNVAGESIQLTNHINVGIMICGMGKMGVGDRIGQWVAGGTDLGGYGPGPSWTRFTNYFLPNLSNPELMGLWKDPAVIPGKVITTNSLTELWVRKIGSEVGPTNVIYLVNAATTNYTFTLNVNQFGGFSNQLYALRNPWTRTTVGLFSNTVPITVPISNGVLYAVYPVSGLRTVSGGVVALGSGDFEQSIAAPITINGFTYPTASNEVASARWTLKNSSGSEQTVSFPGAFTSSGSATFTVSNSTISEFTIYRTSIRTQILVNTYQLAAAFTPASVSGMVAWFRPENLSSYSNGDVVTNWADASGNGYNATNVLGSAPLKVSSSINGLAGAAFTGAKHLRHLIGDYATSTIFAVVQRTNTGTGYQGIFYAGASSSAGTMMLANLSTANKWGVYTTVEQASSTQLTSATTPVVLSMVDNGASGGTFYTNGVANGTWTGNTIGSSEPTIGGSAAQLFTGYISEVIFFTGALSGTDRAAVESYLRGKYGL